MPADYIQRMFDAWQSDTGLVCAPPIGSLPQGLWAEVECAFLNTYQARWQYAADSTGFGFAQGRGRMRLPINLNAPAGQQQAEHHAQDELFMFGEVIHDGNLKQTSCRRNE